MHLEAPFGGVKQSGLGRELGLQALDHYTADHIDHVVSVAGAAHVGIGSDFDGIGATPEGLESVTTYPALFAELIRRGYTDEQLKGIAGLNVLRVMRKAEAVAARLQKERPPSDVRIEEVDPPQAPVPAAAAH